jgi:hypothetical protein
MKMKGWRAKTLVSDFRYAEHLPTLQRAAEDIAGRLLGFWDQAAVDEGVLFESIDLAAESEHSGTSGSTQTSSKFASSGVNPVCSRSCFPHNGTRMHRNRNTADKCQR